MIITLFDGKSSWVLGSEYDTILIIDEIIKELEIRTNNINGKYFLIASYKPIIN
tara:strand:+ start:304 stop:465 length:162 start_codon:yes stop_codon:yes gene_type:complete